MGSSKRARGWPWVCVVVVTLGCSGDGLVVTSGSVSWDGKPLAAGIISFHPENPRIAPQGGQIVGGRFRIRTAPGRHRVEIRASRPKAGAVELTPGATSREHYIPPRYNDESTLEADVSADRVNDFTFHLTDTPTSSR